MRSAAVTRAGHIETRIGPPSGHHATPPPAPSRARVARSSQPLHGASMPHMGRKAAPRLADLRIRHPVHSARGLPGPPHPPSAPPTRTRGPAPPGAWVPSHTPSRTPPDPDSLRRSFRALCTRPGNRATPPWTKAHRSRRMADARKIFRTGTSALCREQGDLCAPDHCGIFPGRLGYLPRPGRSSASPAAGGSTAARWARVPRRSCGFSPPRITPACESVSLGDHLVPRARPSPRRRTTGSGLPHFNVCL